MRFISKMPENFHISKNISREVTRWKKQGVRIVAVAGKRKAGKSVFVEYIKNHYPQFQHLRIADAPVKIAKILGISPERRVLHALFGVNDLLRPVLGRSAYLHRVAMILDKERPRFAVVEALRTDEEYKEFVKKRGGILLAFDADAHLRHARAVRQHDKADERVMTLEEFIEKDHSPLEKEIFNIIKKAHVVFENNYYEKHSLYRDIDFVMRKLGIRKHDHKK